MAEQDKPSQSEMTSTVMITAISSALQTLIIDGTRHAGELKGTDKIIENHNALLKLDPSNQTLQDGLADKKESRDQSFNQIKKISHDFSIEIYKIFQNSNQLSSTKTTSSSSSSSSGTTTSSVKSAIKEDPKSLMAYSKILEKQIKRNEEEVERIRAEHRTMIEKLQGQLAAQEVEIERIRADKLSTSSTSQSHIQLHRTSTNTSTEDAMILDTQINPPELETTSDQFQHALNIQTRTALDLMITDITNLREEVITFLKKEIPNNLQRSVKVMQQDVQSTLEMSTTNHLKLLTDLVNDLVVDFDNRLSSLESIAKKFLSVDDQAKLIRKNTKDPRILKRLSTTINPSAPSSAIQPNSDPANPQACNQQ
ncbi:hypothetical protein PSTG_03932 [Puccinia striiformis f. sp. tritici PST-78]|uniref:Uncharacterized protein n=1 Tax=Puccinia striiformis f. sp. tritici PST-78 TaxID=1165861 RepID=A0A0L0VUX0_9BASI|nr:hypothetical protein PSTG_03932 [Puccinia striiformis f. sp. tritici PST-78]